jgi:O-antigen ligase
MVRLLVVLVVAMLPLALAEAVTGQRVMLHLFRMLLPTIADGSAAPRWGLTRVQGPFEHPILFGVFCGSATALTYLVLGQGVGVIRRWAMTAAIVVTALLSLSSGPIVAILVQLGLLAWNDVLGRVKARWRILWVLAIIAYLVLEVASNQPVFQLLTRFAFDPWTAYYRLLIFQFGWASVMAHPLFGTGFNEWLHPLWMTSSIDMFWLVPALRYGLPGALLFMLAFFLAVGGVAFRSGRSPQASLCCTAYLITMTGFFLVGWTVHFWMATYVLFMFLLGSGMWLLEPELPAATDVERASAGRVRTVGRAVPQRRQFPAPAARAARVTRKAT